MATVTVTDSLGNVYTYTIPVRIVTVQTHPIYPYLPVLKKDLTLVDKSRLITTPVIPNYLIIKDVSEILSPDFLTVDGITKDTSTITLTIGGGGS